jgi:hypothetical protein
MQTSAIKQGTGTIGGRILAYINFNGTGTPAIRKAFNVSSISDLGLGKFRINFTNPMLDTNFVSVGASGNSTGFVDCEGTTRIGARTTSYIEIACTTGGSTNYYDPETINVVVFN